MQSGIHQRGVEVVERHCLLFLLALRTRCTLRKNDVTDLGTKNTERGNRSRNTGAAMMLIAAGVFSLVGIPVVGSNALVAGVLLISYGIWLLCSRMRQGLVSFIFAVGTTTLLFWTWPGIPLNDDAAIVLKYMDNFAHGWFYCYNPQDGPLFGISGFVHGILAGGIAYSHVLSPVNSLFASNFIGTLLVCFLSLRILARHLGDGSPFLFPLWALLLLTSELLIANAKSGLETPLHTGIVLACVVSFLDNNTKMLFLFSVVACVSKLDAVPVVAVLISANVMMNWERLRIPLHRREYLSAAILFGMLPLAAWIAFSVAVFGSPLPQTAYAKYLYHRSASTFWFPFLESLFHEKNRFLLAALGFACLAYVAAFISRSTKDGFRQVLPQFVDGAVIVGYLLLYYMYNPLERMGWYYVIPAVFAGLQGVVLLHTLVLKRLERHAVLISAVLILVYSIVYWPGLLSFIRGYTARVNLVERERQAIGDWVSEQSQPTDTLLTGFGHIAQRAGLYTIDCSGLNSKIATDLKLDIPAIIRRYQPRWIAIDTVLTDREGARSGYRLRRSYFNLASLGRETWRVYERSEERVDAKDIQLVGSMIASAGRTVPLRGGGVLCRGNTISFSHVDVPVHAAAFVVGLNKDTTELLLHSSIMGPDGTEYSSESIKLGRRDIDRYVDGYTQEWVITLPKEKPVSEITITVVEPQGAEVELIAPTLVGASRQE